MLYSDTSPPVYRQGDVQIDERNAVVPPDVAYARQLNPGLGPVPEDMI
jgi:hypothetical protein